MFWENHPLQWKWRKIGKSCCISIINSPNQHKLVKNSHVSSKDSFIFCLNPLMLWENKQWHLHAVSTHCFQWFISRITVRTTVIHSDFICNSGFICNSELEQVLLTGGSISKELQIQKAIQKLMVLRWFLSKHIFSPWAKRNPQVSSWKVSFDPPRWRWKVQKEGACVL